MVLSHSFINKVGLWVGVQSAGDLVSETSQLRILHSAEVDNLSPFDSKIACLCQSIEINNNTHVYRHRQVPKPIGSEVKWAECSLIIGTGCWVQVFSLNLDNSVGLWLGIQSAGELASQISQLRILHSAEEDNLSPFDSKIAYLYQSTDIDNNKYLLYFGRIFKPCGFWIRLKGIKACFYFKFIFFRGIILTI